MPFNIDHEVGDSFSLLCAMGQLAAIQVNEVDVLLQHLSDTVVDTDISFLKRYFTDSAWTMVLQLGKYVSTKFQYKSKLIHPSWSEKGRVEM